MRYQNWDVLLFPETSKTPVQEFKTQCFVTKDYQSTLVTTAPLNTLSQPSDIRPIISQLPVLTCFVPSLVQHVPFRISIHTWEKPKASRTVETLMQPEDSVAFEARIYIDGLFVCGSIFDSRSNWPQVINTSSQLDKDGNPDVLRFPPFHQEILQQSHWNAGEMLGRIRVVIAEGFAKIHRTPPFERVKDVVAFSFQHAPLHVLEYSAIAWPNANMWQQTQPRQVYNAPAPSVRYDQNQDEDAHAHSPRKLGRARGGSPATGPLSSAAWQGRTMAPPALPWSGSVQPHVDPMADPFVDFQQQPDRFRQARWTQRSSTDDVLMPDYRSQTESRSSQALTSMTGVSYEQRPRSDRPDVDDASIAELVEALSPLKGTLAPSNTPSGEQNLAIVSKAEAAPEAPSTAYSNTTQGQQEDIHKENDLSVSPARPKSHTNQGKNSVTAAADEPVYEGKRKRPVIDTPEGRKTSEGRIMSATAVRHS